MGYPVSFPTSALSELFVFHLCFAKALYRKAKVLVRWLSLIRRRPRCFVSHAWSLTLIAFAFNADSLAPMISLKRWISRSRSGVSDISAVPRNARDFTLDPHAIMRSLHRSTKPHRAVYSSASQPDSLARTSAIDCTSTLALVCKRLHKSNGPVQLIARVLRPCSGSQIYPCKRLHRNNGPTSTMALVWASRGALHSQLDEVAGSLCNRLHGVSDPTLRVGDGDGTCCETRAPRAPVGSRHPA
jgi:hypothetical protein